MRCRGPSRRESGIRICGYLDGAGVPGTAILMVPPRSPSTGRGLRGSSGYSAVGDAGDGWFGFGSRSWCRQYGCWGCRWSRWNRCRFGFWRSNFGSFGWRVLVWAVSVGGATVGAVGLTTISGCGVAVGGGTCGRDWSIGRRCGWLGRCFCGDRGVGWRDWWG